MVNADVNWEMNVYSGAVHSFTNPDATAEGAHYDEQAAKRAWRDMQMFFIELFGKMD
jgi:dienelactone hydrolase